MNQRSLKEALRIATLPQRQFNNYVATLSKSQARACEATRAALMARVDAQIQRKETDDMTIAKYAEMPDAALVTLAKSGVLDADGLYELMTVKAEELRRQRPELSPQQAFTKYITEPGVGPRLFREHQNMRRGWVISRDNEEHFAKVQSDRYSTMGYDRSSHYDRAIHASPPGPARAARPTSGREPKVAEPRVGISTEDEDAEGQLKALAAELRKRDPSLSPERAYTRALTDPANRDIAKRAYDQRMAALARAAAM
jgi:hypothetical protein